MFRARIVMLRGLWRGLRRRDLDPDPVRMFQRWYGEARACRLRMHDAVMLATVSAEGKPSARAMLLKGAGENGFTFYSNYGSRKAAELEGNPRAALVFFWSGFYRQVRIEGRVERVPPEESDAYFATRPRGSQLGAWASRQSSEIADRRVLDREYARLRKKHKGGIVPRPEFWGGYRLVPDRLEFWQGRANRLHDRFAYLRDGEGWRISRLAP